MSEAATQKHLARLAAGRARSAAKRDVPHATGTKWTGKTTTPRAPRLSYQSRTTATAACRKATPVRTAATTNKGGWSRTPRRVSAPLSSTPSSCSPSAAAASASASRKKIAARPSGIPVLRRGRFSSPYRSSASTAAAISPAPAAAAATTTTTTAAATAVDPTLVAASVPLPKPPSLLAGKNNNTTEDAPTESNLADELLRLRNELRAEEARHASLVLQEEGAAPAAPGSVRTDTHTPCVPPPMPPPGPPPRDGRQSPEPTMGAPGILANASQCVTLADIVGRVRGVPRVPIAGFDRQVTHHVTAAPTPPLSAEFDVYGDSSENDEENENAKSGHNQLRATETIATPPPKQDGCGMNWDSMQSAVQRLLEQDVSKRKRMEARLRKLEKDNLSILGVDAAFVASISRKRLKNQRGGSKKTIVETASAKKSKERHMQRMGRALSKKLGGGERAPGGALSRSGRF